MVIFQVNLNAFPDGNQHHQSLDTIFFFSLPRKGTLLPLHQLPNTSNK